MVAKGELLQSLADTLVKEMQRQIAIADHVMTGALLDSVEGRISQTITGAAVEIWLEEYGLALDQGVPPERIPYTPPTGRGGRSAYIEGLARWAKLKLGKTDPREALSIAFAVAEKHKKVGLPTKGPTEFIQKTLTATETEIQDFLEEWAKEVFEAELNAIIIP